MGLNVHLVDGTYELFRYHFSPGNRDPEVGATRGVVGTCLMLLEQGATHVGVATDHVIESFRNDMWPTYKDGSGVDPQLKAQFPVVEDARSEEHTSELQSLMRISYAVFCLTKKK